MFRHKLSNFSDRPKPEQDNKIKYDMYSEDMREKIREKYEELRCFRAVAKHFKISHNTVKMVVENLHKGESSQPDVPERPQRGTRVKCGEQWRGYRPRVSESPLEKCNLSAISTLSASVQCSIGLGNSA